LEWTFVRGSAETYRVLRGGSWNNNTDNCRASNRNNNTPDNRNNYGFRVVVFVSAPALSRRHFALSSGINRLGHVVDHPHRNPVPRQNGCDWFSWQRSSHGRLALPGSLFAFVGAAPCGCPVVVSVGWGQPLVESLPVESLWVERPH
jgi:hypothetical protein